MSEEISPEVIKKTQKYLGKYVKKPPLTEKLLKKPPFRFLHDIITIVIKETGFLKGLYSPDELKSENVKDKEAKVLFLNKLIDAVKSVTKTDLAVRSSKIVAGLEPNQTNLLLQTIGKAIDNKVSTAEYVSQLNSGQITNRKKESKKEKNQKSNDEKAKAKNKEKGDKSSVRGNKSKTSNESTPKSKVSTPKDSSSKKKSEVKLNSSDKSEQFLNNKTNRKEDNVPKGDLAKPVNEAKEEAETKKNDKESKTVVKSENLSINAVEENKNLETDELEKQANDDITRTNNQQNEDGNNNRQEEVLVRPKSARPKSNSQRPGSTIKNHSVKKIDAIEPLDTRVSRPKSSLRPPSVRPSSARPGAPRLRLDSALNPQESVVMGNINVIVENADLADEEETVVVQMTSEVNEEPLGSFKDELPAGNKGQLVEQILEQIQEDNSGKKGLVEVDYWENEVTFRQDDSSKDISRLCSLIQNLTKTANPLGKLMNYLHEDIDAMHAELQTWTNTKRQLYSGIQKQKRLNAETDRPLLNHLEQLTEEINRQDQLISNVRANILRNQKRIQELIN